MNQTIKTQYDKDSDTYTVTQRDRAGEWNDRPLLLDVEESLDVIRGLTKLINSNADGKNIVYQITEKL